MKKKILVVILALAMVVALAACNSGGGGSATTPSDTAAPPAASPADDEHPDWISMNLVVATFLPEGNPTNGCFSALQAKLDKYMPGKMTMDVYYAGTLLNDADTYDGILGGTCDIGIVNTALFTSRMPYTQLFSYPGIAFNGSGCAAEAHWNWIQQEKPAEYDNIVVLMTQATGPMALVTKDPVKTVEDVAGKQYRADGVIGETVGAWGGIPVSLD